MKGFLQHSLCTLFLKQQPDEAPTIAQTNSDPPEGVPERATGRRGVWGESRLPGCPLLPHGLTIPSSLQTEVSFHHTSERHPAGERHVLSKNPGASPSEVRDALMAASKPTI